MSSTTLAVRNYRFVVIFTLAALTLGVLGFVKMPRQEDPTLPAFGGTVRVVYPVGTAEEVEDRIVEPIEEALHALEEIDTVEATAADGVAVITGEFRDDVDKDEAFDLFAQAVSGVQDDLPDGVTELRVIEQKPSAVVAIQAAIHGPDATDAELRHWAEELEDRWNTLGDAGEIRIEGAREQQVHVMIDPDRMAASGIALGQVSDAIAAANGDLPGGSVMSGVRRLSIRPNPRFETLDDIRTTVLTAVDGRPVLLGSFATVRWGSEDPQYVVRHQGEPAVVVTAKLKEGRNVLDMTADARLELDRLRADLPDHLTASVVVDQSDDVSARLRTFGFSLLQGGAIIVLFVAIIVGWRAAVVAITAMTLAVGISFWLLDAFGVSLQQMSIAGLVVVLGLLVDNAVVVFESILHERQKGTPANEAAIRGTDRVASAVTSATATTVAAFVPMLFMAGSVGDFTRDIPTVVSLVLIVSLGVALFVTPLVAIRLFGSPRAARPAGLQPILDHVARRGAYARTLDFVQARPRVTVLALLLAAAGLIGIGTTLGMNFFPRADDKPLFLVRVKAPQGTNLWTTHERAIEVERWILDHPLTKSVTTNVGEGNPMVYYNTLRDIPRTNFAELLVTVPRDASMDIPDLARRIRDRFAGDPRFRVETKLLVQGPPVGLPVSIRIDGDDLERLREHADALADALREIPGAINVSHDLRPGAPRLELHTDPVKIHKLGLNSALVAREIRLAMAGGRATTLRVNGEDHDVVVRVAAEGAEGIDDLERVRVPLPGGTPVPLAQLTRPSLSSTYARIMHTDLERSVIVGADTDDRLATEIVADLLPAVRGLDLAPGESWEVIGEDEERDVAFLSMLQNVVVAMGLIYGILVLQFGSFKLPLVIFTSIPVALAGSVAGLLVSGWPFGFTAFIGLLALVGIVVNDAIVLVDRVNQYRRDGETLDRAVRHAAQSRLQPIILTTLTTQAGLLPLTLFGGSMWGPMGWVIIGGLSAATLVTLVLVPALYLILERGGERRARLPEGAVATATVVAVLLITLPAPAAALDLGTVLDRVEAANPTLDAALADLEHAAADHRSARSGRWPRLELRSDAARTNEPTETFGLQLLDVSGPADLLAFDPDAAVDVWTSSARVDWLLWDFSREELIDAAAKSERAREQSHRAVARRLRLAAVVRYFEIVQWRQRLDVIDATLELVDRELTDAELRLEAGRTVEADVLGLRARRSQVRAERASIEAARHAARARLGELMDVDPVSMGEPDADTTVPTAPWSSHDEVRTRARERRPEVRAARLAASAGDDRIGAAHRERLPRLVASARAVTVVPEFDTDREDASMQAAIGLRWSPFQGGRIGAEVDRARADRRRAEAERRAAELEVEREAIEAWTQRDAAHRRLEAAGIQRDAAEEAYRIVSLRFAEGRDTLARLFEAERALTDARTQGVRARAAVQIAEARLRWAAVAPLVP